MRRENARPRVIRGTRTAPLPLLPSGPGGVCGRPLHGARDLTNIYPNMRVLLDPPDKLRQRVELIHMVRRGVSREPEQPKPTRADLAELLQPHRSPAQHRAPWKAESVQQVVRRLRSAGECAREDFRMRYQYSLTPSHRVA